MKMIESIISGTVVKQPEQRQGKSGKPFVTATVRVGRGEETVFVSVIAFDDEVQRGLMLLGAGDAVSLTGTIKPKVYNEKAGLDMIAQKMISLKS
jgi:single-stranded DNA-binding protein